MKLFRDNIHHEKRVAKISHKLDIPEHVIEETLDIMYQYIRDKLTAAEPEDKTKIMTEEEFNETFPIIAIPKLGYIAPSYDKYLYIMKNKYGKNKGKSKD